MAARVQKKLESPVPRTKTKMTKTTNPHLRDLIRNLKKKAIQEEQDFWKRLATDLEKPRRQRRAVNISRINRFTEDGDFIVVPGKVLATGELNHKLTVAAWKFSKKAEEKINTNGKVMSLDTLLDTDIKGKKIKIIG